LDALDAAVDALRSADLDGLNPTERFCVLERMETALRRQVAASHAIIHRLEQFEGCPPVHVALSDVLRISRTEARRRIRDAAQLAPRSTLTGQPLPPELPATAAAWHRGILDPEHLRTIQKFIRNSPTTLRLTLLRIASSCWLSRQHCCGPTNWTRLLSD
jgi:hypothetical protein